MSQQPGLQLPVVKHEDRRPLSGINPLRMKAIRMHPMQLHKIRNND